MRFHLAALLILGITPLQAQSEAALRSYFEGRTVRLRIDMPGSEQGVDVYPDSRHPVDFPRHASRLKSFGTAVRRGDEVQITKLKVKNDLIEFQLGGGGFGTFGDDDSPTVSVPSTPKSTREKNLEKDLQRATDAKAKRQIREELDDLRRDREREDARNRASAAQAEEIKAANIRQRRLEGGSRFNLRFANSVPREALSPDWIMQALAEYVDFTPMRGDPDDPPTPGGDTIEALRKGLTAAEVDDLLGRPVAIADRKEGTLAVSTSIYHSATRKVTAEFVEGVLVRFTITSP
jgi:hypothetical protein